VILSFVSLCSPPPSDTPWTSSLLQNYPDWALLSKCSVSERNFFFFVVLWFEFWAYTLSHSISSLFWRAFFEIGSHKLFAWAGFELWSSWSLPPE
jgi:hypothetical protein